ncbi:hypothetical protein LWI28_013957 [Acer negundo]|uniref:Pentatricopeptide repeat-containing protein n=1 Tax=Acer negundo TaxID=4023 RepID=A0AAD5IZX9_ACENE|nr:hypothetical protein LWI28_013957 [Acer negundo]
MRSSCWRQNDGNDVVVTQGAQFESLVEANENVLEVVNDTVKVGWFEKAPVRDVFTWIDMVSGYIHNGIVDEVRRTFDAMPEKKTISWNAMIVGHVQSKKMDMARELFEAMICRNVGSWNTMITGYAQSGEITLAKNLFDRTPLYTIACDSVRFAEPMNDNIVLSVLIGQIVSTLGFGFENVKTKGVRRRQ